MILVAGVPNVLVVNPSLPVNDVQELIAYAKANPGKLNFASSGSGTSIHLVGRTVQDRWPACTMTHVPYKGSAPALHRPGRRPGAAHVRQPAVVAAADQGRQAARARGDERAALRRRCPTCRRSPRPACRASRRRRGSACSRPPARRTAVVAKLNAEIAKWLASPEAKEKLACAGCDRRGRHRPRTSRGTSRPKPRSGQKVVKESGAKVDYRNRRRRLRERRARGRGDALDPVRRAAEPHGSARRDGPGQRRPAGEERDAAERRHRAQAAHAGQRQRVEAAREQHDAGHEQPAGDARRALSGPLQQQARRRPSSASACHAWYWTAGLPDRPVMSGVSRAGARARRTRRAATATNIAADAENDCEARAHFLCSSPLEFARSGPIASTGYHHAHRTPPRRQAPVRNRRLHAGRRTARLPRRPGRRRPQGRHHRRRRSRCSRAIDRLLAEVGSDKTRILSATIFLPTWPTFPR